MLNMCSQILIALILTIITGFISNIIWKCLYEIMHEKISKFACITLRLVCLFFVIPIGFILINLLKRDGYLQGNHIWQLNFRSTSIMSILMMLFLGIWVLVIIIRTVRMFTGKKNLILGDIPEEDMEAVKEFRLAKKKLKIHGPVRIYRNDMVYGPRMRGVVRGQIILPFHEYTKKQLRVIYCHELMHYKHHDILFKYCSVVPTIMIQFMKKISIHRNMMLDELCEYHCDISTIAILKGEMEAKDYFSCILKSTEKERKHEDELQVISKLNENSTQLKRRVQYINMYERKSKGITGLFCLFIVLFITFNMMVSYITGYGMSVLNDYIYKKTEQLEIMQESNQQKNIPLIGNQDNTNINYLCEENEEPMMIRLRQRKTVTEVWEIEAESCHVSDSMSLEQGQHVAVSCVVMPRKEICWIGIIEEKTGKITYTENIEVFDNEFVVPEDGIYRIFVQNQGNNEITISMNIFLI